ncbi:MAG: hypothetical protein ACTS5I_16945 [Rhodanobacter sp.]
MALALEDFENALKQISSLLGSVRARAREVRSATAESIVAIQAIPNTHADVLAAIAAIDSQNADAWELSLIARKNRLEVEIVELLEDLQAARAALVGLFP